MGMLLAFASGRVASCLVAKGFRHTCTMRKNWKIKNGLIPGLIALFLSSCAGTEIIQIQGFKLNPNRWHEDETRIKARAAFDFQCPEEQLTIKIITTNPNPGLDDWADQVGVLGCGHQAVYVRSAIGAFVLNAEKQPASSAPSPHP